jgi:hypothetical protein
MVEPGELRSKILLGSEAVYRVLAVEDDLVLVEVVKAPGLEPGDQFRFTLDAIREMAIVGA